MKTVCCDCYHSDVSALFDCVIMSKEDECKAGLSLCELIPRTQTNMSVLHAQVLIAVDPSRSLLVCLCSFVEACARHTIRTSETSAVFEHRGVQDSHCFFFCVPWVRSAHADLKALLAEVVAGSLLCLPSSEHG